MASDFDTTEFVDTDVQAAAPVVESGTSDLSTDEAAPTQKELEGKATDVQSKLAKLEQRQKQLEKERNDIEEAKRRRAELTQGHQEMLHHLTRGVAILEEDAVIARREAEQMATSLANLKNALENVSAIDQKHWNADNWTVELTKALTAVENARHEWNAARLKWPRLDSVVEEPIREPDGTMPPPRLALTEQTFGQLCRLGFALTWPIAAAIFAVLLVMLFR